MSRGEIDVGYVRELYKYDRWANARALGAAAKLSPDQFTKDLGSSHRSVRDTLVHILSSERVWIVRWNGSSPRVHLDPANFAEMESLLVRWRELESEMVSFLDALKEDRLQSTVSYATLTGQPQAQPLWQQMVHMANHSTYHRGQVTTMLRQLGAEPANTDLITFFREHPAPTAES